MRHRGYAAAIMSALLFGIGTTLNKIVLAGVHPTIVAGAIYFFAGVSLSVIRFSPIWRIVPRLLGTSVKTDLRIHRRDFIILGLGAISGSLMAPFFFLNGLNQTAAINASLLQNAESLFTVLIALIFLKERALKKDWIGIVFLIIGGIVLATNAEFHRLSLNEALIGNIFIIAACLFWSIDNNLSKFLSTREDLIPVISLKCLIGGTTLLLVAYLLRFDFSIPLIAFPYLISAGTFSTGFSILSFMLGLRWIGAMRTGAVFSTASLFGALFAFIILKEAFTVTQILAGLTMILGVYVLCRK